ncbi:MAG: mannonate dehydratase [Candidatus Cyclobacteriaceae bacterium M2_1C_046]
MGLEQTWRWYGPHDPVTLWDARQAGATGIVTALHHIPTGEVWKKEEILKRKQEIESVGLTWSVAESINVHEDIKTRSGSYKQFLENYRQSLLNLGACGINTVCYNFMPVLDATRTDFEFLLPNGATALRFDSIAFAAFELFILKRKEAENSYNSSLQEEAHKYFNKLSPAEKEKLTSTIVAGFPNVGTDYTLDQFQQALDKYKEINVDTLKQNLAYFLREIIPAAEEAGVYMTIHPDDPPFSIMGLPRIVSTEADIQYIYESVNSAHNGLCFCTGSFGARRDNDLSGMVKRLGIRINFIHLRSTISENNGSFYESDHLAGDVDMFAVMKALLEEQNQRKQSGIPNNHMPMRSDHGHQMLDDLTKKTLPGYSAIGRLKGLAELRGLELGISKGYLER